MHARKEILFDWQPTSVSGWGTYARNLMLVSAAGSSHYAIPIGPPGGNLLALDPFENRLLQPLFGAGESLRRLIHDYPENSATLDRPILHGLNGNLEKVLKLTFDKRLYGAPSIGVTFLEQVADIARHASRANQEFAGVIAGSTWNRDVLIKAGVNCVRLVIQGIDTSLFHPGPRRGFFSDRFVVFSGGKIEYRKGQDLVLQAFAAFAKRHPNSVLVTCWHNIWPTLATSVNRNANLQPLNLSAEGQLMVGRWAEENGLAPDQVIIFDAVPNYQMPQIVREADIALFPNRSEGGTNLVAMEAMACGVPVILSANTGHMDLIAGDNCYALHKQSAITDAFAQDWGESDVDEIVETLERAYTDPTEAKALGARGAAFMADFTWARQIGQMLTIVDEFQAAQ